jgi:hypothetical protein
MTTLGESRPMMWHREMASRLVNKKMLKKMKYLPASYRSPEMK